MDKQSGIDHDFISNKFFVFAAEWERREGERMYVGTTWHDRHRLNSIYPSSHTYTHTYIIVDVGKKFLTPLALSQHFWAYWIIFDFSFLAPFVYPIYIYQMLFTCSSRRGKITWRMWKFFLFDFDFSSCRERALVVALSYGEKLLF